MAQHHHHDSWQDMWNKLASHLSLDSLKIPTPATEDDLIWLHSNTAYPIGTNEFGCEFLASFFHKNTGEGLSDLVSEISTHIGLADDDTITRDIISKRAQLFLNKIIVGRKLSVKVDAANNGGVVHLPASGSSGISAVERSIPFTKQPKLNDIVKLNAILDRQLQQGLEETDMRVVGAEGWAIVSDIDDTIKITDTLSFPNLLRHTFAEEPQPTPSFPQFYAQLKQVLNDPAFFYLSASPYNLYPFLLGFVRNQYPFGQLILRDMSWMSVAGLADSLSVGTQEYKTMEMKRIMGQWLPNRKYVCIGDSTQTDPESYGQMYREYPQLVKAIWIRVVTGVDLEAEKKKNAPERFEEAFKGVPTDIWKTFHDVSELQGLPEELSSST